MALTINQKLRAVLKEGRLNMYGGRCICERPELHSDACATVESLDEAYGRLVDSLLGSTYNPEAKMFVKMRDASA